MLFKYIKVKKEKLNEITLFKFLIEYNILQYNTKKNLIPNYTNNYIFSYENISILDPCIYIFNFRKNFNFFFCLFLLFTPNKIISKLLFNFLSPKSIEECTKVQKKVAKYDVLISTFLYTNKILHNFNLFRQLPLFILLNFSITIYSSILNILRSRLYVKTILSLIISETSNYNSLAELLYYSNISKFYGIFIFLINSKKTITHEGQLPLFHLYRLKFKSTLIKLTSNIINTISINRTIILTLGENFFSDYIFIGNYKSFFAQEFIIYNFLLRIESI